MSIWTTKAFDTPRNYIVLQHPIKGTNHVVNGIKFRSGYCIVEKDSKTYFTLKRIPVLKSAKEFPLLHLKKLDFITRTSDIRTVFGQDVYAKFLEEEQKLIDIIEQKKLDEKNAIQNKRREDLLLREQILAQIVVAKSEGNLEVVEQLNITIPKDEKCSCTTLKGTLCTEDKLDYSPSGYCHMHIFEDPRLPEFGLNIPNYMTKDEKAKLRIKFRKVLEDAKKKGKF